MNKIIEIAFKQEQSLIGRKFGKLTIIKAIKNQSKSQTYNGYRRVQVKCECGVVKNICKHSLARGDSTSCRTLKCHPRFVDRTGKEYKNIKVLKFIGFNKKVAKFARSTWLILCKMCNKKFTVDSAKLSCLIGADQPCANCANLQSHKNRCKNPTTIAIKRMYVRYATGAKIRKLSFRLSFKDFKKLIFSECFYCGIASSLRLKWTNSKGSCDIEANGIDRVNNALGYVKTNSVACCFKCNELKMGVPKFIINKAYIFLNGVT